MARERRGSFKSGHWIWDDELHRLTFVSQDAPGVKALPQHPASIAPQPVPHQPTPLVAFKETVGTATQYEFRKKYRRKVKLSDPDVVTIQDIKDVVIFICEVSKLTPEFITYFHTETMDRFLRSLIIYFQFYFQIWNAMQLRRKEAKRKLRQPIVTVLENIVRDDLADLRSMLARDYAVILLGIGDSQKFHHMGSENNELSDRDRRLFEMLIVMAVRVVWIGLCRRYLALIEKEMDRLLRTKIFSPYEHKWAKSPVFDTAPEEDRILFGKAFKPEQKLYHRSPAVQEIVHDNHDYRMLAIGICDTQGDDPRQLYLEAAYSAPEEELQNLQVPVGILGIPRKYFDPMLKPKELSTTGRRMSTMKPIPDFVIPPNVPHQPKSSTLPKEPAKFCEMKGTKQARKEQCKMWRNYLECIGRPPKSVTSTLNDSSIMGVGDKMNTSAA